MIESMVTATAHNSRDANAGKTPTHRATWNAGCLADVGAAFVARPPIPPRNVNRLSEGKWVHLAKVAFERYFVRRKRTGTPEPMFEKRVMNAMGIMKLKA